MLQHKETNTARDNLRRKQHERGLNTVISKKSEIKRFACSHFKQAQIASLNFSPCLAALGRPAVTASDNEKGNCYNYFQPYVLTTGSEKWQGNNTSTHKDNRQCINTLNVSAYYLIVTTRMFVDYSTKVDPKFKIIIREN